MNVFASDFVCVHTYFCVTQLQLERDELYKTFTQNVQKVQQNVGLKITQLEKSLETVTDSLEKKQAQLSSVLSASNIDQTALYGITNRIKVLLFTSFCFLLCQQVIDALFLLISDIGIYIYLHISSYIFEHFQRKILKQHFLSCNVYFMHIVLLSVQEHKVNMFLLAGRF